ncbi:MAG TPA: prolyl oligopeptidase family serine peptidase, partial [Ktedonobacteraceae bacterium]|nr:prolyl oligopeptidase family serine peptidase [Ktedonobacteraceae bacterium]
MTTKRYSFDRYLNIRAAYGPSFSRDAQQVSFLTDITGVPEVWAVSIDLQVARPLWPDQVTFRGERITSATFSPKGDVLLVAGDIGGNERTQLYTLRADGSEFTALTNKPDVMYLFGDWSPDGSRITYSSNERDARYFDVYEHHLESGKKRLLLQDDSTNYVRSYSPDGKYVLVARQESNTRNELLLINVATGLSRNLTPELGDGPALHQFAAWSADRKGLYLISNRGRQFLSLAYLDLATKQLTYLNDASWDVEKLAVTKDGSTMAVVMNENGYSMMAIFDVSRGWELRQPLLAPTLPGGVIYELAWSQDGSRLALTFSTGIDQLDIWVWNVQDGVIKRVTQSALGGIPQRSFVAPSLVHYPSFDERKIPAFLYLPRVQQSNLPVIIDVHGGPEGQTRPSFYPVTQYLINRGYGVLAPNVRGSTGYGYEYQSLDDVRKRMDSVADLKYAALWLAEKGIADPQRIAVMGGSYGGFMVLAAITTYPDLWAAAVDIVGIANF